MNIKTVVSCSDKYLFCLRPFATQFNRHYSSLQPVVVAGYTYPNFILPDNFFFRSIRQPQYPKEKWVDGMLEFLQWFPDNLFVLMLEDYWISRNVDNVGIDSLSDYMSIHPDILRMDLTSDRLYTGGMRDVDTWGHYDLIEAPGSQYQMSLQAGIWNRGLLIKVLKGLAENKHSAWDVELEGTTFVNNSDMRVLGTRQYPMRYTNGYNDKLGLNKKLEELNDMDRLEVMSLIPESMR